MDFDSLPNDQPGATPQAPAAQAPAQPPQSGAPASFDDMQDDSEKYGTTGEQVKAGLEGVAQGVAGPLAPLIETKVFGAKPEDIRGRAEINPVTHGIGEAAGLVGGALTGTGEAALLGKAGEAAVGLSGLAEGAKAANYGFKVGSAAVQQAAEMAVLQSGDEVSKMILQDPDTSAQSALANVGIASVLGGVGGAFFAGAVSPLWNATVGPKAEQVLEALKSRVSGTPVELGPAIPGALDTLGIELPAELRAGLSVNPTAQEYFGTLRRGENQPVLDAIEQTHKDISDSVAQSIGIPVDDIAHYSENEAGHTAKEAFEKELNEKYEPQAAAMQKRDEEASTIGVPDEQRNNFRNQLLERGISSVGTDSPYYKEFKEYGERVLAKDTIGGIDKLKTEINNRMRTLGADPNVTQALRDIKSQMSQFQETQIIKNLETIGAEGVSEKSASQLLNARAEANRSYSEFAGMMDDLTNHMGIGDFRGVGTLKNKIADKLAPEQLLNKFSPRGNADFIPFLQQHFPETYSSIQRNEAQRILKGSVKSLNGESTIDFKSLGKAIEKLEKEKPELLNMALSPEAQAKVKAANLVSQAIPNPKNSGTTAGIAKQFKEWPTSALAAVGWLSGHGATGGLTGGLIGHLGAAVPEAYKLSYLRFLAADQPVSSAGFKAMVDFMHNTYKGQNLISKATANVLKSGAQVLTASQMPVQADRDKLDKQISNLQKNPDTLMQRASQGALGDYLPSHQTAVSKATTQVSQYLQSIKPKDHTFGPLDTPVPPQPSEIARYNRALDIATQPAIVMQHIKDGTLVPSDIQDLHNMYPQLYTSMAQKLSNTLGSHHADEEPVPYKTRVGISLFLGQPIDASMSPQSIMAAQPTPQQPQPQQGAKQPKGSPSKVNQKQAKSYMTPSQSGESDRSDRS